MQPDRTPQLSAEYLDQIAPPEKPSTGFSKKQILLFGGLAGALVLAFGLMMLSSFLKNNNPTEKLAARLLTVQSVVNDANDGSKIKNSKLRALNSDLRLYVVDVMREASAPFNSVNIDLEELNPNITKLENATAILEHLEDERLNARYDRSYAREMASLLETTLIQMQDVYKNTSSKSLKEFLETTYDNLEPIQQQFEDIKL